MTTNQKVTVLTTNGRRQNVPITPNTTLLQILEQVCQKHNFESNGHGLKHHNKIQDLSLTFRFSGLPNNCLLEMFETESPRDEESDVVLCVQLETNERFQGTFKSTQTVEQVLNDLCKEQYKNMENAMVLYMRQEVYGDLLTTTKLKSLGLTSGRAIVRLLDRKPEALKTQANVYVPPTIKPVETVSETEDKKVPKKSVVSSGFNVTEVVKSLKTKVDEENAEKPNKEEESEKSQKKEEDKKPVYSWDECEGRSMNEGTKETSPDTENMDSSDNEPIVFELGERHAVVFSLETAQKFPDEIPDSFFDLTTNDLKLLLRDLRKQASGNEDAPLLTQKLRELEESKSILRKMEQYKHCVIRIQLPDRIVLQGTFRPTESVADVHEFLRKYLQNPDVDFHLFTIPPKKILDKEKTLVEVDCVPTAILHFGVEKKTDEPEMKYLQDELYNKLTSIDGALLSATKSRGLLTHKVKADEYNEPTTSIQSTSTGAIPKKPKNEDFKESKAFASNQGETVPKWFKPIKK